MNSHDGAAGSPIRDFRDLLIWQKAIEYARQIYTLTKGFPRDERFGLTNQVRRAAVSVSSNIAEGHARQGREFPHFLSIARGSLAETPRRRANYFLRSRWVSLQRKPSPHSCQWPGNSIG
ncbi:MAG: four helix bundle protein [Fimbriiglobus sp.]